MSAPLFDPPLVPAVTLSGAAPRAPRRALTGKTMFIDTHAHLDEEAYGEDLPDVLDRARKNQVTAIVSVGIDEATSLRARALAEREEDVDEVKRAACPMNGAHTPMTSEARMTPG